MIENNPTNVIAAFEILLEEIEAEIDFVNQVGAKSFEKRDYDRARDALENALEELLGGKEITNPITNPIGCNVKWDGKDAHWMPPEACDLV